jgi:hypothetical protein
VGPLELSAVHIQHSEDQACHIWSKYDFDPSQSFAFSVPRESLEDDLLKISQRIGNRLLDQGRWQYQVTVQTIRAYQSISCGQHIHQTPNPAQFSAKQNIHWLFTLVHRSIQHRIVDIESPRIPKRRTRKQRPNQSVVPTSG